MIDSQQLKKLKVTEEIRNNGKNETTRKSFQPKSVILATNLRKLFSSGVLWSVSVTSGNTVHILLKEQRVLFSW